MMLSYTHQEILLKHIAASINVLSKYLKKEHVGPSNGLCNQFKYDQLAQINCPNPDCDRTVGSSSFLVGSIKPSQAWERER